MTRGIRRLQAIKDIQGFLQSYNCGVMLVRKELHERTLHELLSLNRTHFFFIENYWLKKGSLGVWSADVDVKVTWLTAEYITIFTFCLESGTAAVERFLMIWSNSRPANKSVSKVSHDHSNTHFQSECGAVRCFFTLTCACTVQVAAFPSIPTTLICICVH